MLNINMTYPFLNIPYNNLPIILENLDIRNEFHISNKYELINYSDDDFHFVIFYINEHEFSIIIRRLDSESGWGINLKIKIYSNNDNFDIISLGSSEKNYKIMNLICKIKLYKITYIEQNIPKIIVQTTYSKKINNILHYNSILTFIELNPEYKYNIYDNDESRMFIKNNFDEHILNAYDLIIPGAFKADFFRYCYLYINGGCYFDCKSILRVPLRNIIDVNDKFLLCKDIGEGFYNAIILTIAKNELLLRTIHRCVNNIYNFNDKFNLNRNIYTNPTTMFSFTGPVLLYNSVKDSDVNIKFIHKHNKKSFFNHDYQRLYVEYNSIYIITKQYHSYHSSSGIHYSILWNNNEVIYELNNIINNKYKFYKFISNNIDKFYFYIFSENIFIVERIHSDSGWGDYLKIKIIDDTLSKELIINIGSSNNKKKIIYLNENFFNIDKEIKCYTFYDENIDNKFKVSISKDKNNLKKLIIINNENTGWNETYKLNMTLNNNKVYNLNIDSSEENIKIIDL